MDKKVSVLISTKNRPDLLQKCLNSIFSQTIPPDEIIITDTSSVSIEIYINSYRDFLNINYNFKPGLNIPQARNYGLNISKNRLVLFIDDDCIAEKKWIEKMLDAFQKNPFCTAITGRLIHIPEKNIYALILDSIRRQRREISAKSGLSLIYLNIDNCLLNKQKLQQYNIKFDEGLKREEDIDLGIQIIKSGGKIIFNKRPKVYHFVRPTLWEFLKQRFNNAGNIPRLQLKWPELKFHFYGSQRIRYLKTFKEIAKKINSEGEIADIIKFPTIILLSVIFYELGYIYTKFSKGDE